MSRHEKTCHMPYVNNKGTDQLVYLRSLISTFYCLLPRKYITAILAKSSSFCCCAGRFESKLVANHRRQVFLWHGSNGPRQANLVLIAYVSSESSGEPAHPQPSLLAHTSSESRGIFRQKARSLAPLNGWACAVKIYHDGMLEDANSLDGAQMIIEDIEVYGLFNNIIIISGHWKSEGLSAVKRHLKSERILPPMGFIAATADLSWEC